MQPEHILILIAEIGGAGAVIYGLFLYLFKNSFSNLIQPLRKSLDALTFNVGQQTEMLAKQIQKLEELEGKVDNHETRLQLIEHEKKEK